MKITFFQTDLSVRMTRHLFRRSKLKRSKYFRESYRRLETDRKRDSIRQSRSICDKMSSRPSSRRSTKFAKERKDIRLSLNILEEQMI